MALHRKAVLAAVFCAALSAQAARSDDVADFYRGQTLEVYIGYSAGGGFDAYARLLARHIGRHVPGNPTVVPVNMPGAASLRLVNWMADAAPRDGTVIGMIARAAPFEPLFGSDTADFDALALNYIGSMNNEVSICVAFEGSGVTSFEDLMTTDLIVGGTGTSGDSVQLPRLLNALLGTRMVVIDGYPGGNDVNLAMERGEVDGRCGWSWSSVKTTSMDWYEDGSISVLLQISTDKHPDLPDVPLVTDLVEGEDRQMLRLLVTPQALGRPLLAPPDIPPARLEALQTAFMATMEDPDFLADAETMGLEISPVSGPDIRQLVLEAYEAPPALIERIQTMLAE